MKKKLTNLILLFVLLSGCTESELVELNLEGTIKGTVLSLDEFGNLNDDNENIVITLEGSDPLISTTSDIDGYYEINNIPSGTYNLIISKEDYGPFIKQGFKVVGGDKPLYLIHNISEISSTTIENLSLEIVNTSEIYLKGKVNHNYTFDEWYHPYPTILFYIYNQDNPSDINYLQIQSTSFRDESGSELYEKLYLNSDLFPSGSQIYVIAYGYSTYSNYYYDMINNIHRRTGNGTTSNIASIIIP